MPTRLRLADDLRWQDEQLWVQDHADEMVAWHTKKISTLKTSHEEIIESRLWYERYFICGAVKTGLNLNRTNGPITKAQSFHASIPDDFTNVHKIRTGQCPARAYFVMKTEFIKQKQIKHLSWSAK